MREERNQSVRELSAELITCLDPRSHRNAGLQPLLHAHVVQEDEALERQSEGSARSTLCSSRNTRAALLCDPQTRDAKWARGSRSQTHRRAAKGGFTQTTVRWSEGLVPDRRPPPLFLLRSSSCDFFINVSQY